MKKYHSVLLAIIFAFLSFGGEQLAFASHFSLQKFEEEGMLSNNINAQAETLSAQQQAISLIAAFAAGGDITKLDAAINQGLDAGLTINEIKEILVLLYAYAGFPRSLNALGELMKVVDTRKQQGIKDTVGHEASAAIPKGEELLSAGKANQTKIAGKTVEGALFDFAPVINQFLQTHLFGDIFERDTIDWQSRELATVSMLSAISGVEPQLKSHIGVSLRLGLTKGQLTQAAQGLKEGGDPTAAERLSAALKAVDQTKN